MSVLKKLSNLRISRYFRLCFVLWDLFLLNLAVFLSLWLYFGPIVRIDLKEVQTISLLSNMFWIFILLQQDAHRSIRIERIESILFRTIKHFGSHIALIGVFMAVLQFQDVSRVRLSYFYVVFFILLVISRISGITLRM
jgi:putative colanic acid biosynthesis UDP-glucose lipid carrier transferase